jgi:hypothetical protein
MLLDLQKLRPAMVRGVAEAVQGTDPRVVPQEKICFSAHPIPIIWS